MVLLRLQNALWTALSTEAGGAGAVVAVPSWNTVVTEVFHGDTVWEREGGRGGMGVVGVGGRG